MKKIVFEGIESIPHSNETMMWIKRTDTQPIEATCWKSNKRLRNSIMNFINTPTGEAYIRTYGGIPIIDVNKNIIGRCMEIHESHALIALKKNISDGYIYYMHSDMNERVICFDGEGALDNDVIKLKHIYGRITTRRQEYDRMLNEYNQKNAPIL